MPLALLKNIGKFKSIPSHPLLLTSIDSYGKSEQCLQQSKCKGLSYPALETKSKN